MNLVKEHINEHNFERGLDPRDAMGIGDHPERLTVLYKDLLNKMKGPVNVSNPIQRQFASETTDLIPQRLKNRCGWGNLHSIFYDLNPDEFAEMRKLIRKYIKMNLVKEHINEFKRGIDPKVAMNTGMRAKIKQWLEDHYRNLSVATKQSTYTINDDLTIDIYGFFATDWEGNFPDYIQFNESHGSFQISAAVSATNKGRMTSLRGCPQIVRGDFECCRQKLKNLIGGPEEVHGKYICSMNPLESLEGLAKVITEYLACNNKSGLTEKDIPKGTEIGQPKNTNVHYWGYD